MKLTVLCAGLRQPHAGWAAIDELAQLLARYFGAELLSPRPLAAGWAGRLLHRGGSRFAPVDTAGGDMLLVVARGPDDLRLIDAIPDARRRFGRIHAWVTDSYHWAGFGRITSAYDALTVTAAEDVEPVALRFGIPVHHVYQGADGLSWAPRREHPRDIDLIGFGRTPPSYHGHFVERFHRPESPHLYLHSPLGHLAGPGVHRERAMLFKLLQRTRIALAFHLFVEPQHDRPRSMMVTSRWLESLLSGCIVAGKRPVSRMASEMLFWPQATLELADDPVEAGEQLLQLFGRDDELRAQRRNNIRNTLLHHDWRDRMLQLCRLFDMPVPQSLRNDRERLHELAATYV